MTLTLPTEPNNYVMNNKGTLYHLVDFSKEYPTPTLCGLEFDPNARVPVNTPQEKTSLLCKRCALSFGIDKRGKYATR